VVDHPLGGEPGAIETAPRADEPAPDAPRRAAAAGDRARGAVVLVGGSRPPDSLEAVEVHFRAAGWTDGLPIVPPTEARVETMLAGIDADPDDVVGKIPPLWAEATVEKVAINAVMAGCAPEAMPVLVAAFEAMLDPAFNLYGVQATTHPVAPLLIVHGPAAARLGMHAGPGVFGPGNRANATLGRAVRLCLWNLGGARPGQGDMATQGSPAKYTYAMAERVTRARPLHASLDAGRMRSLSSAAGAPQRTTTSARRRRTSHVVADTGDAHRTWGYFAQASSDRARSSTPRRSRRTVCARRRTALRVRARTAPHRMKQGAMGIDWPRWMRRRTTTRSCPSFRGRKTCVRSPGDRASTGRRPELLPRAGPRITGWPP
jgi:hypothetical protein